ncbi:MAG: hypothetical protein JNL67_16225 [Planctomycetaceae bacterium]|nr:hypothetical protein [Planctomycetaceae bacterium]
MTKRKTEPLLLVNKLSVADAQHLHRLEGGFLSSWQILYQLVAIVVVHALVARAIYLAQATIWHLLLPIVAEYYAYLVAVPVCQAWARHGELAKISQQCLRVLAVQGFVLVAAGIAWPLWTDKEMVATWSWGFEAGWNWVVGTQMHWPILLAGIYSAINVKQNVDKLVVYGPPFAGPGIGCAMRAVVAFFALVLVPAVAMFIGPLLLHFFPGLKSSLGFGAMVWLAWLVFVTADLGRLYLRWDIQRRLLRIGKLPESGQRSSRN